MAMETVYFERTLGPRIVEASRFFPAVVLTGARQVGKSTLLCNLFPDYRYVTLDKPIDAEMAQEDPEAFLRSYPSPLIIDEIQYAPNLFRFLKARIDSNRDEKGQYILTGSQKFSLMKGVSDSLAGRIAVFELEGLSLFEINREVPQELTIDSYLNLILKGSFPQVWKEPDLPLDLYFSSYASTYLERDVRDVLAVSSQRDFERFMRACAIRTGQVLNKADLAREVGVSPSTVSEWISVLHSLGHIVLLEPWFSNLGKRLAKAPKLYLSDSGLACYLLNISRSTLPQSTMIGHLWETFVFSELRKTTLHANSSPSIWYYRDKGQREVDFLIQKGSDISLLEAKWTSSPQKRDARQLNSVEKIFNETPNSQFRVNQKILISRSPHVFSSSDEQGKVTFAPVTYDFIQ